MFAEQSKQSPGVMFHMARVVIQDIGKGIVLMVKAVGMHHAIRQNVLLGLHGIQTV